VLNQARFVALGVIRYPGASGSLRRPLARSLAAGRPASGPGRSPTWAASSPAPSRPAHQAPWRLPPRWIAARSRLEPTTSLNFVSATDLIGDSGSAVINRAGEFVGVVFDANLAGLASEFVDDERSQRAIGVCPRPA
jgi:Peptidase S46